MFDFKEVFTASMILFAVIDIIGATPIVISLKEKVGKIESEKATIVAMLIMIGFLFLGEEILNLIGLRCYYISGRRTRNCIHSSNSFSNNCWCRNSYNSSIIKSRVCSCKCYFGYYY